MFIAIKMAFFLTGFPNLTNYFFKKNTESFEKRYNVFFKNKTDEKKLTQIYEKKLTLCGYTIQSARVKNLPNNILEKILLLALDLQALGCGPIDAKTLKQKKELYNALFFVSKNIRTALMLGIYESHIFPDINKIDHPQKYYDCYYDCYMEYFLPANITKYLMVYYLDQNEHSTINTKNYDNTSKEQPAYLNKSPAKSSNLSFMQIIQILMKQLFTCSYFKKKIKNYDNTSKEQPAYLNERLAKNSNLSFMQTIEILKKQLLTCSHFIDTNKIITSFHASRIQCNNYSINDPDGSFDANINEIKTDNASQQKAIRETCSTLIFKVIRLTFESYPFLKQDILIKNLICLHKKYKENEKYNPITQALERSIFLLNCMDNLSNMQYLVLIQSKNAKDGLPMKNELQDSLDNSLPNFITQLEKKYNFQFNKEPENYDLLCQPFCIELDDIMHILHSHTFQNTLFSNDTVDFNFICAYIEKIMPEPSCCYHVLNKVENIILPKETLTPALLEKIPFFCLNLKMLLVKDIADDVTHEVIEQKVSTRARTIKEPFYIIINNPLNNTKPFENKYFKIIHAISKTALPLFCPSIININDNEDTKITEKMFTILYSCVSFITKYKQYIPQATRNSIKNNLLIPYPTGHLAENDCIPFLDTMYHFLLEKITELQLHINHFLENKEKIISFCNKKIINNLTQINTLLARSLENEINDFTLTNNKITNQKKDITLLMFQIKNLIHIYKKYSNDIKTVYGNSSFYGKHIFKSQSKTFFSLLGKLNKKYKDRINRFYKKHATILKQEKASNNNFWPVKENNFLLDFIEYDEHYDEHIEKVQNNLVTYYQKWAIENGLLTSDAMSSNLTLRQLFNNNIKYAISSKIKNGSYEEIREMHYTQAQKQQLAKYYEDIFDQNIYTNNPHSDDLIETSTNLIQKAIFMFEHKIQEDTFENGKFSENLNN